MGKKIGIIAKNYKFLEETLKRNIGDGKHKFDKYGTPIGKFADFELTMNGKTKPWFEKDRKKRKTTDYFEYMDEAYFNEVKDVIDGIAVIRNCKIGKNSIEVPFHDKTRLGEYRNESLTRLMLHSYIDGFWKNNITQKAYSNFGYFGSFGIEDGVNHIIEGRVRTQSELIGNVIEWTPSDHMNYSSFDPYINFFNMNQSDNLLDSTSDKTKNFIAKSILGYDLLGKEEIDFNLENINGKHPKKYYVGKTTRGTNYIDSITDTNVNFITYKSDDGMSNNIVRLDMPYAGSYNMSSERSLQTYAEMENGTVPSEGLNFNKTVNLGVEYGRYVSYNRNYTSLKKDIIHYTNRMFQEGNYKTLISRFHTDNIGLNGSRGNFDITSTAISKYGMSHGRNLLKVEPTKENGYDNPYCRVWTYHHQYSTLKDVIRPFNNLDLDTKLEDTGLYAYRTPDGLDKLSKYGVRQSNGLVKITPSYDVTCDSTFGIKRCMFSIENLAWKGEKDFFKGREEQKGPLGGRIMWFPPYDLKFSENVGVSWNQNQFIGRGESIYTYTNTERSGNLSFKILIDHPSIINQWRGIVKGGNGIGDVDDIHSNEQQLLRFFAGCELLKAQKPETKNEPKVDTIKPKIKTKEVTATTNDELVFYVFYPNNYSGVDDEPNGIVKPMEYLINGVGANKILHTKEKTNEVEIIDYGTHLDKRQEGYEMNKTTGISTIKTAKVSGETVPLISGYNGNNIAYQYCPKNKNGKKNYWAYRCDNKYANQVLYPISGDSRYNYYDSVSYGLNTNDGLSKIIQVHQNDNETHKKGRLFSFTDVFCAIQPEAKKILNGVYNEEKVNIISDLLGINKKGYTIDKVEIMGFASSHGYTTLNDELGKNRAKSILKWLNYKQSDKFNMEMLNYSTNKIGDELGHHDSNALLAKIWRCSRVSIKITKKDVTTKVEVIDEPKPNVSDYTNNNYSNQKFNTIKENPISFTQIAKDNGTYKNLSKLRVNEMNTEIDLLNKYGKEDVAKANNKGNTTFITDNGKLGYGKEYEFFRELCDNEPFLHSKIVEKLRYFDPAFHSITPEGFQSRLTFLHQCTRQGNTASVSDINNMNRTAKNLSFGKPPICVLRIGDFYYTKIIIDSLTIDYDDTTWDLNDEGIGVMPMMANVNISFKFLGGSDLSGPINRLQNSLSFNYYANTSVYDNRAEEIKHNDSIEK